ncbi:MAG: transposase [Deltaproteobacteria bacterium]
MPRSARLDIPGLLQHVIVRGVERCDIFIDHDDRCDFTERLQLLLQEEEVDCLAWALMSNHFHLLLRPRVTTLAKFMRRLLTGYAVAFNLRHNRCGHLFQNRYKSIVCDEDAYLLELVRYIHLNPLRAGIVPDLPSLERFPWSGHSPLMGNRAFEGQNVDEVLGFFGKNATNARCRYRSFVKDGISMGNRDDLVGRRVSRRQASRPASPFPDDPRILGGAKFSESLRKNQELRPRIRAREPIPEIIRRISGSLDVSHRAVASTSRQARVLQARAMVCRAAVEAGHSGAEVGRHLGMSRSGVCAALKRLEPTGVQDEQKQD